MHVCSWCGRDESKQRHVIYCYDYWKATWKYFRHYRPLTLLLWLNVVLCPVVYGLFCLIHAWLYE